VTDPGRFDVHSHLLPGIDDGSSSIEETLACARALVQAGYTHSFCTPHFWTSYPKNTVETVRQWTTDLQKKFDEESIPLKIFPGGEIALRPTLGETPIRDLPTFAMQGKYVLIDLWADKLPKFFEPTIKWMQSGGLTVILAHPERMRAVQDDPKLGDYFSELGLLLQGNLQCFSDRENGPTRTTVERFLHEDRYFLLGSDLHNFETLPGRLTGLQRAIEMAGPQKIHDLTIKNPRTLITE
jgi:protein-tyrosine phosphatase